MSGASISSRLSMRKMPPLEWKAPPPSYCQEPSTVAIEAAACIETAAVALAGEAVAEAEEGLLRRADEPGEGLDLLDGKPGDGGRPFRRRAS